MTCSMRGDAPFGKVKGFISDMHTKAEMLEQSLKDSISFADDDMAEAKKGLAEAGEKMASAEGELKVTSKDFAVDIAQKRARKNGRRLASRRPPRPLVAVASKSAPPSRWPTHGSAHPPSGMG